MDTTQRAEVTAARAMEKFRRRCPWAKPARVRSLFAALSVEHPEWTPRRTLLEIATTLEAERYRQKPKV